MSCQLFGLMRVRGDYCTNLSTGGGGLLPLRRWRSVRRHARFGGQFVGLTRCSRHLGFDHERAEALFGSVNFGKNVRAGVARQAHAGPPVPAKIAVRRVGGPKAKGLGRWIYRDFRGDRWSSVS